MRASRLLAVHDGARCSAGLEKSLGDSFLLACNPWFCAVRALTAQLGFGFRCERSELGNLYQTMPLLALEDILLQRTIPYVDTVTPLRCLVASGRDACLPSAYLLQDFRRNYVMHEASHCIAHHFLCDEVNLRTLCGSRGQDAIELLLLCEAFANAVDALAASSPTDGWTGLFLALNSYVPFDQHNAALLRNLLRATHEPRHAFELTMAAFFAAQLQPTEGEPSPELVAALARIARAIIPDEPPPLAALAGLLRLAFGLSVAFRSVTAPAFFGLLGVKDLKRALGGVGFERALMRHITRVQALCRAFVPDSSPSLAEALPNAC